MLLSVSPSRGPEAGGTLITILGSSLDAGLKLNVNFGVERRGRYDIFGKECIVER